MPFPIQATKIIEYAAIFSLFVSGMAWVNNTVATKADVLIAMNTIEAGRIASNLVYYERQGTDHLSPEDKAAFTILKKQEIANETQRKKLLGLD